ncbi:MAG: LamG domain-containing protein [Firmicutes bacterium]|nr:LamG domain-containing protein [Bacillota bacterium]
MKNAKSEKGAVTLLVLVTMLFFVAFLITTYMILANKARSQKEVTDQTRQIYNSVSAEEAYRSYFGDNIVPIYTKEQLFDIGTNKQVQVSEAGGKIYNFVANATYVLMSNLQFDYNGIWNTPANAVLDKNGHQLKIHDTSKTAETIYYYYNDKSDYKFATTEEGYIYNGLAAYYDGINNTGSGHSTTATTWKDLSGNGNNGILAGNYTWNNNNIKGGTNGFWADCGNNQSTNIANEITMEVLVKKTYDSNQIIIAKNHTNSYYLNTSGNSAIVYFNNVTYTVTGLFPQNTLALQTTTLKSGIAKIYMNGIISAQNSGYTLPANTGNLYMGKSQTVVETNSPIRSEVYAIRLYNRALSDEEIAQNYKIDKIRYGLP